MSLYVYLEGAPARGPGTGIFVRENGANRELSWEEWEERYPGREPVVAISEADGCYSANITHNLGAMADAAGIYQHLWRPDEIGIEKAAQLVEPLLAGLRRLRAYPAAYRELNPPNGWGTYEGLVTFVEQYLEACRCNPDATVRVSR